MVVEGFPAAAGMACSILPALLLSLHDIILDILVLA
jgi:hypothetical protein